MVTHANVLHNAALIERTMEVSSDTRGLFWLPPYHDMGLVGAILGTAYTGITTMLMSPLAFLQRPARWLQAIQRFGATHSGGPNFAYDLCVTKTTPEQRAALDLSAWRVAVSGAEPVRHETLERFSAAFAPAGFRRSSFRPAYGLAEATLMVCCGAPAPAPRVEHVDAGALAEHRVVKLAHGSPQERPVVSSGKVPSGVEIMIVDPEAHTVCPAGRVGEIWIRGASVAAGYWNRPEESARVFGARVVETGEGPFLRTGDLGFVDDGDLFVTGRIKDLIIIDGRNHYPQDIEATVERGVPAARAGGAAAFAVETGGAERLVVALEVDRAHRNGNAQHIVRLVRRVIADEHAISVGDVVLLRAGGVPKTSSGKVQRHACRAGYLASTLDLLDGPA
jgi:acyl-CoA synthetase (AMP-forming)/AMP-acid ligase II